MQSIKPVDHAESVADHLEAKTSTVHKILRKYESKEVVDDELTRSVEALRSMGEIAHYFPETLLSQKTATFLPLNLPLYSFVLFAGTPAYQSASLIIRPPNRMKELFDKMFQELGLAKYYPNTHVFSGSREHFLTQHCQKASVVLFTGKYENFLRVRKACSKDTLILFNGVGHNPLVVTPSADLSLAVEKTLQVKLFNNGQDCAGPDTILVHSSIADEYTQRLVEKLTQVRCGTSYQNDDVRIGPMFESSALLETIALIANMRREGARIVHGGQVDIGQDIMYPCVIRTSLRQTQNFKELYSPLFLIAEYERDPELALYFDDPNKRYQNSEMYVSLFGESNYVAGVKGSIVLKDRTIHDVERGTEEYGGYSPGASSVSYQGIRIPKPLLIPREIHTFLSPQGQKAFTSNLRRKSSWEQQAVETQFGEVVRNVFGNQLVFAYIFGSFAAGRDKRYSDIDTLVCVHKSQKDQAAKYLEWLFHIHEMFGRIPDFKYPAEIVSFAELQTAVGQLATMKLSATSNEATKYDAMVWCHSLSQPWIGVINEENIPAQWKTLFLSQSSRLLRSFLEDLEQAIMAGRDVSRVCPEMYEVPRAEPELSRYIGNLSNRGLISVLKMVPFEETPIHTEAILRLVYQREFMGKRLFSIEGPEHLHHPCFRFGVVSHTE